MGNWRRVQIVGTCPSGEIAALRAALVMDLDDYESGPILRFHCLMNGGAAGLPNWAAPQIDVIGNLAERGYDEESIAETLETLAKVAPGLNVVVHLGGDYEADECVSSIVLLDGLTVITSPKVKEIPKVSAQQMQANMMTQMMGGRRL